MSSGLTGQAGVFAVACHTTVLQLHRKEQGSASKIFMVGTLPAWEIRENYRHVARVAEVERTELNLALLVVAVK